MKHANYTVYAKKMIDTAGGPLLDHMPTLEESGISTRKLAEATARKWAAEHPDLHVYIWHQNSASNQTMENGSYLNPDGNYELTGKDWGSEYKVK